MLNRRSSELNLHLVNIEVWIKSKVVKQTLDESDAGKLKTTDS